MRLRGTLTLAETATRARTDFLEYQTVIGHSLIGTLLSILNAVDLVSNGV